MTEKTRLALEALKRDSTPEEVLYWEFDAARKKTGAERDAFKCALAKYASFLTNKPMSVEA